MKKILIVKTSSMGDLIHAFPAVADAAKAYPDAEFHWLAESSFAEIPRFHTAVSHTIEVAWRNWRHQLFRKATRQKIRSFLTELRQEHYDAIVDLQGLLKSAVMARLAHGKVAGPDKHSARESFAAWLYHKPCQVVYWQHVIERNRQLLAKALDYTYQADAIDYGIETLKSQSRKAQVLFIHGTSRKNKEWPVENWIELAHQLQAHGLEVLLPWGNAREKQRAEYIAQKTSATLLPKLSLTEIKTLLQQVKGAVAVDTGLGHLAAAVKTPCVSIYPVTDPEILLNKSPEQIYCRPDQQAEIKTSAVFDQLVQLAVVEK